MAARSGAPSAGGLFPLGLSAVAEASWGYAWYLLLHRRFDPAGVPGLGPASLLFAALAASLLVRWLEDRSASPRAVRLLTGPGSVPVVAAWLALQPGLLAGSSLLAPAALLWAWHRGLRIPGSEDDHGEAVQRFRSSLSGLGLALLAAPLLLRGPDYRGLQSSLLLDGMVLMAAGLLLLSVTHQAEISRRLTAGRSSRPRPSWLGVALLLSLAVLVLAWEGGGLLTGRWLAPLLALLAPAARPLAWLVERVLQGAVWLVRPLATVLTWLVHRALGILARLEDVMARLGLRLQPPYAPQKDYALHLDPRVKYAVLLAALFLTAALLTLRTRRRSRQRALAEGLVEVHESIWTWASLSPTTWLGALRRWFAALRRTRAVISPAAAAGLGHPSAGDDLRSLFRRYLSLGVQLGQPREASETSARYATSFLAALAPPGADPSPASDTVVRRLTTVYQAARYGEQEPDPDRLRIAADDLQELQNEVDWRLSNRPGEGRR